MGKNLVFVPECRSTNTLALQISQQSAAKEGTLVITDHQTAGKGQHGNHWEAEPRQNLTFSLILKPAFLPANRQFLLNVVICLALKDYLSEKIPDAVYIKWPNDILVHERKISGILIENQLQGASILNSIAGIGLNVNQTAFRSSATATSLALLTGRAYPLDNELPLLVGYIESRYLQLRQGYDRALIGEYLAALYRRHKRHTFSADGAAFEGVIEDLDQIGRLRVRTDDGIRAYGVKEIRYEH